MKYKLQPYYSSFHVQSSNYIYPNINIDTSFQ